MNVGKLITGIFSNRLTDYNDRVNSGDAKSAFLSKICLMISENMKNFINLK